MTIKKLEASSQKSKSGDMCILKSDITKYVHVPLIIFVWFKKNILLMATRNPAKNRFILLVVSPVIYQGFSIIPGAVGVLARISGSQAFTEETFFQFGGGCDSQSMDPCKEAQVFLGGENNGSK